MLILLVFALAVLTASGAATPSVGAENDLAEAVKLLGDRLDQLVATAEPPLFKRHLISVNAIVHTQSARAMLYASTDLKAAEETLGYLRELIKAYHGDAAQWNTYLQGRRALSLAWLSARDRTLQFYNAHLPADWDQQKVYPLLLNLHGAAPTSPLFYLTRVAGGIDSRSPARSGYHIMPFGRGNSSYRDIGEIDVLEAYDDVHRTFKIDPDRRYLYGFSMGGSGTWRIARRTPDRWAAIAPCGAGGPGVYNPALLARNVTYLPIWIFIGEADRGFEGPRCCAIRSPSTDPPPCLRRFRGSATCGPTKPTPRALPGSSSTHASDRISSPLLPIPTTTWVSGALR